MKAHPGAIDEHRCAMARGHRRGPPRSRRGSPPPLPAPALRRSAAACRPRHGLLVPAEPHRAGRADHRARRHDAASRPRHGAQPLLGPTVSPRVYVSHDLAVVGGLVSTVAIMYAGRVVELGPTESVFGDPVHPYTRGLLAAIPSPDRSELLRGIEGQPPRPGRRPTGCFFAPRCELAAAGCAPSRQPLDRSRRSPGEVLAGERGRSHGAPLQRQPIPDRDTTGEIRARGGRPERQLRADRGAPRRLAEVPADCCVAVVGESGSGKTTLARTHRRPAHQLHREPHLPRRPPLEPG